MNKRTTLAALVGAFIAVGVALGLLHATVGPHKKASPYVTGARATQLLVAYGKTQGVTIEAAQCKSVTAAGRLATDGTTPDFGCLLVLDNSGTPQCAFAELVVKRGQVVDARATAAPAADCGIR